MEDRALKAAAQFMGRELLPLLGVEGDVRRIALMEAVFLEVKEEKQRAGIRPKRKELLKLILTSLMDGELSQAARIKRSLKILKK